MFLDQQSNNRINKWQILQMIVSYRLLLVLVIMVQFIVYVCLSDWLCDLRYMQISVIFGRLKILVIFGIPTCLFVELQHTDLLLFSGEINNVFTVYSFKQYSLKACR